MCDERRVQVAALGCTGDARPALNRAHLPWFPPRRGCGLAQRVEVACKERVQDVDATIAIATICTTHVVHVVLSVLISGAREDDFGAAVATDASPVWRCAGFILV